jgi:hypothetical protein
MKDDNHGKHEIDHSLIQNPDTHHEEGDVRIKPVALFMFWLMVATGIIAVLMIVLFNWFEKREQKAEGKKSPLSAERSEIPPEPRLQLAPKSDEQLKNNEPPDLKHDHPLAEMQLLREEEDLTLGNYTWVDQQKGIVGLPIEEAKRLILQKGLLQSRSQGTQNLNSGKIEVKDERPQAAAAGHEHK